MAKFGLYFTFFFLTLLSFGKVLTEVKDLELDLNDNSVTERPNLINEKNSSVTESNAVSSAEENETTSGLETSPSTSITSNSEDITQNEPTYTWGNETISDNEEGLDPFHRFSSVRTTNQREFTIHSLSNTLLHITKEVLSISPRASRDADLHTRLQQLQKLSENEVIELLALHGIVIPSYKGISCDESTQYYRTMDGSCNNFLFTCWGKADEPYSRWLPPAYANGIDAPRKRADGHPLPSPRQVYQWVSSQFEQNDSTTYKSYSNILTTWGQMIAHETLLTPTVTIKVWDGLKFKDEAPDCCEDSIDHPDCISIKMNYEDGFYTRGHCMSIARSAAYVYSPFSCRRLKLGLPREQMNQVTSFIDASLVYGSSVEDMNSLRENNGRGARLIVECHNGFCYPPRRDRDCKSAHATCDQRCFKTGERRANEHPVLGAFHTIWIREHNRLVDALRVRGWPEETLFYVVRKIMGALMQHITYKEYLPVVLGSGLLNLMNLTVPTDHYRYDPLVDPTLFNVFVAAAFRYGHSMISSRYMRRGRSPSGNPFLSQDFFNMDEFCSPREDAIAYLLYGQADQKPQKVDCLFSKQITNHLFAKKTNGLGMDLFSINVQRGRDHGLPAYNQWRQVCGLPKAKNYSDLKGTMPDYVIDRLSSVYGPSSVDEVDLFVGGVSEFPVNGGILGPTFTCIVANQFKKLKFGDRFWYENIDHPGAFTADQINSIQKNTLSSLICRNSDIKYIQPMAFQAESALNPKLSCNEVIKTTDVDLNLWP